jgi:integrase
LRREKHIIGRKVGKKFLYSRESIESYLNADASGIIPREFSKMVLSPEDEKNLERENNMKWKNGKGTKPRINMGDFSLIESKGNGGHIYYMDYYCETEKKRHTKNLGKLAKELKIDRGIIADRKAAEIMGRRVRNALYEQEKSQDMIKKDITFREFAEIYLDAQDGKKANSLRTVRSAINSLVEFFGNLKLSNLTLAETLKYVHHLRNKRDPIEDSTIGNYLVTFGSMISFANRYEYEIKRKENIIHLKDYYLETEKRERELEPDEQERLFGIADPFWKRLLRVELDTGLRLANICGLEWSWVDFDSKMIIIPAGMAKGKKPIEIHMTSMVEEILKHIRAENPEDKYVFMRKVNGSGRQPLAMRWIQNEFSNLLGKVEIEDLHFHDLRRTFAMRLVRKGVDVLTLKGCMGHSNIVSTMAYVTEDPKLIRKAFLSLDEEEEAK